MKTFWAFVLCVLGFYARGDQLTIPGTNIVTGNLRVPGLLGSQSGASYSRLTLNDASGYMAFGWDTYLANVSIDCYGAAVAGRGRVIVGNVGGFAWSSTTVAGTTFDTILTRETSATIQLGEDAASPVSQTLKACDGSGTDKNGASLTFQGGQATGTGGGGDVIVQTSIYTNSSGSTLRAYTTRSYDRAKPTALTDATTNLLFTVSLPVGCHVGGLLDATIFATDGTDFKSHNSAGVSFSAVNKGGTITASISESAQLETHSESVGTQMTDTWTVQQSGSTVAILVTPGVGSLMTPSTFNCKWGIVKMNSNGPATVTPN